MKKGERTREHILDCAEKAFSEKGFYLTQVSDIVDLAHVAKGTIYQYFKNKEDVFLKLLERYATQWEKAVSLNMTDYIGDEPGSFYASEYLKHRLYKTAIFFSENHNRSNIILRMGIGVNEVIEEIINLFEERVLSTIRHDIALGQSQGHIPKEFNLEITSNAILGSVLRLTYYFFVIKKSSFQDLKLEGLMDQMVKLVLNVLKME